MKKVFSIEVSSDLNYEDMVADIYQDDSIIAKVIQEKGVQHMEIVLFKHIFDGDETCVFILDAFIETLQKAKDILIHMKKIAEE
jgi:hypothetical protein